MLLSTAGVATVAVAGTIGGVFGWQSAKPEESNVVCVVVFGAIAAALVAISLAFGCIAAGVSVGGGFGYLMLDNKKHPTIDKKVKNIAIMVLFCTAFAFGCQLTGRGLKAAGL